jgi:hypothetical protein
VTVIEAARSVLAAIVLAAAEGQTVEAALAFKHLSDAQVRGGDSILDLLMFEDLHAQGRMICAQCGRPYDEGQERH